MKKLFFIFTVLIMTSCASQYTTKNGCRMEDLTEQQFDGIKYLEQKGVNIDDVVKEFGGCV